MICYLKVLRAAGRLFFVATAMSTVTSCGTIYGAFDRYAVSAKDVRMVEGSGVSDNLTPMEPLLACYADKLKRSGRAPVSIAVGEVRDYTGKQSADEGFAITQGGSLMAYSALGKLLPGIKLAERFDPRIADMELNYGTNRQLGDGAIHTIEGTDGSPSAEVPWLPYFGGSVLKSDYYIVGGITEVNYNIRSGGSEVRVGQIGPKVRTYTMNIAVDLRIVGTQSLQVLDTVSVQKQITGYEVGLDVFRFFGTDLYDVNIGQKSQEPIQMGVRMAIEHGVLDLIQSVTKVDGSGCKSSAVVNSETKSPKMRG